VCLPVQNPEQGDGVVFPNWDRLTL
jgi:hypothetical protein